MKKINSYPRLCTVCGNIYYRDTRFSRKQFEKSKCCGWECKNKLQSKLLSGELNVGWKGGKPKCMDCGKTLASYNISRKRCKKCWYAFNIGENNANYKTNVNNYKYIHQIMITKYGSPVKCDHCGKKGEKINGRWNIEWANISGEYSRDREDWLNLCKSCHRIYDLKNGLIQHFSK